MAKREAIIRELSGDMDDDIEVEPFVDHLAGKLSTNLGIKEGRSAKKREAQIHAISRKRRDNDVYPTDSLGGTRMLIHKEGVGRHPAKYGTRQGNRTHLEIVHPDGIQRNGYHKPIEPRGTNEILEFLGYITETEKKGYLRGFNGNTLYGADVIRAAYHLARFFGIRINNHIPVEVTRETIKEIAYAVDKYGTQTTDLFLSAVGITNARIFRDFLPLNIGGKTSLVPGKELDRIVVELGESPLKSPVGPTLMSQLGYSATKIDGFKVYW